MKLRYFEARNFRSLKDFNIEIEDFLVLTGENNSGKSNFFHALKLFLSSTVKGVGEDTFSNRETGAPIALTARWEELTHPEKEKLGPWLVDGVLTVSKEYALDAQDKVVPTYTAIMKVPAEPWLREDFADYKKRDTVSNLPIGEFLPAEGQILKGAYIEAISRFTERNAETIEYVVEHRQNPGGYKQVLDGYLPELHVVPAVRDATEETKTTSTALLGKLIGLVVSRISASNPAFNDLTRAIEGIQKVIAGGESGEKIAEICDLETTIQLALSVWDVKVKVNVDPPEVEDLFQLGTNLTLDDGLETGIEDKGHGLQRSLIFALIRVWAQESRRQPEADPAPQRERANIFAFEEPELFLHPQVCRATYEALKSLSQSDQVFLCTHSSHFVSMEDYRSLALVRKLNQATGTSALRVKTDLFEGDQERKKRFNMIRFFNPDRNEVFFARRVALVEGATEKAVIPVVARRLRVFEHSLSVVDCAGKNNLTLYMAVLNAFRIPYIAIYDEDPIPDDLKPGGVNHHPDKYNEAKRAFDENERIQSTCDSQVGMTYMIPGVLEDILGVSRSRGEKVGKPYAAVEHFLNEDNAVPAHVDVMVREVYDTTAPVDRQEALEQEALPLEDE